MTTSSKSTSSSSLTTNNWLPLITVINNAHKLFIIPTCRIPGPLDNLVDKVVLLVLAREDDEAACPSQVISIPSEVEGSPRGETASEVARRGGGGLEVEGDGIADNSVFETEVIGSVCNSSTGDIDETEWTFNKASRTSVAILI